MAPPSGNPALDSNFHKLSYHTTMQSYRSLISKTSSGIPTWISGFWVIHWASLFLVLLETGFSSAQTQEGLENGGIREKRELPELKTSGEDYRTPRAGEGFRTRILGREVVVEERDRRKVTAWDLGLTAITPGISGSEALPFASLYFWRRPDEKTFFRAVGVGVYNDLIFSKSTDELLPFEAVFTFENFTIPFPETEAPDGFRLKDEELYWGHVRPGLGVGIRKSLAAPRSGQNDNMAALSLIAEPGYLYFDGSGETADNFTEPQDTFEARFRLRGRLDNLERNLLELAHRGFSLSGDLVYGARSKWKDWGLDRSEGASRSRDYLAFSGHLLVAAGVPFVKDERHRILASIHGGLGSGLDRFSSFRIGGGPTGEEYGALARPIIPGSTIEEFTSRHYITAVGEYRWELAFFTYLSLRSSVTYLDRRRILNGRRTRSDDLLGSTGVRLTTGFLFNTQLQMDYNYNAGVLRKGEFGGHEITVHLAGEF